MVSDAYTTAYLWSVYLWLIHKNNLESWFGDKRHTVDISCTGNAAD